MVVSNEATIIFAFTLSGKKIAASLRRQLFKDAAY